MKFFPSDSLKNLECHQKNINSGRDILREKTRPEMHSVCLIVKMIFMCHFSDILFQIGSGNVTSRQEIILADPLASNILCENRDFLSRHVDRMGHEKLKNQFFIIKILYKFF